MKLSCSHTEKEKYFPVKYIQLRYSVTEYISLEILYHEQYTVLNNELSLNDPNFIHDYNSILTHGKSHTAIDRVNIFICICNMYM